MAQNISPVYVAVARDATIAAGAGESVPVDLGIPLGQGAQLVAVDLIWGLVYQIGSSEGYLALSLDPNDPIPASRAALQANLDVIAFAGFQQHFTTSGYGLGLTTVHRDLRALNVFVTRNVSMLQWNDSADVLVDSAVRVYYQLVELNVTELARLTGRQR